MLDTEHCMNQHSCTLSLKKLHKHSWRRNTTYNSINLSSTFDTNTIHHNLSAVAEISKKKYPQVIKLESEVAFLAWLWVCCYNFENKALKYQSKKREEGVNEYGRCSMTPCCWTSLELYHQRGRKTSKMNNMVACGQMKAERWCP